MASKVTSTYAQEESTFRLTATIKDSDSVSVTVKTLKWTLTDTSGTVINSRENVAIASPTNPQKIFLYGDDLQVLSGESGTYIKRQLLLQGTYDSDDGIGGPNGDGTDMPFNDQVTFTLENLTKVT